MQAVSKVLAGIGVVLLILVASSFDGCVKYRGEVLGVYVLHEIRGLHDADPLVGTWRWTKDPEASFKIAHDYENVYTVHNPDGSDFQVQVGTDGKAHGVLPAGVVSSTGNDVTMFVTATGILQVETEGLDTMQLVRD